MPRVLKRKNFLERIPEGAKLVGRPSKKWSNPFKIGEHGTREEVLEKYRLWLFATIRSGNLNLEELRGKDLVCYCAPLPCHADLLLHLANVSPQERARIVGTRPLGEDNPRIGRSTGARR